jgi:hypothetical protein
VRICESTGAAYSPDCAHAIDEWFPSGGLPNKEQPISTQPELSVDFPVEGMVFNFNPAVPQHRQTVILRASAPFDAGVTFLVNGSEVRTVDRRAEWTVRPGVFEVTARSSNQVRSAPVRFVVN